MKIEKEMSKILMSIMDEAFCITEDKCLKGAHIGGNAHLIARVHHEKTGHETFCRRTMEKSWKK